MRTEKEIRNEIELIKKLKKELCNLKYPCTQSAVSFIQMMAAEEMLEWVLENEEK